MTSQPPGTRGTDAAPAAGSAHGPLPPLLLLLTVVTGTVDAVSILRLASRKPGKWREGKK